MMLAEIHWGGDQGVTVCETREETSGVGRVSPWSLRYNRKWFRIRRGRRDQGGEPTYYTRIAGYRVDVRLGSARPS